MIDPTKLYDPLSPVNPASPDYTPPTTPAPLDLTHPVGLTGADQYNVMRLTRASTYLQSVIPEYPDLHAAVGLAPTDWATMDQHIQALGGQPGYGLGFGQLFDHLATTAPDKIAIADLKTLQQNILATGAMPPGTQVTGTWSQQWADAFKVAEDHNWQASQSGTKVGGASTNQFLGWLSNVLPSKVSQALVGTAKFLFGSIPHTAERFGVEATHQLGGMLENILPPTPFTGGFTGVQQSPETIAALQQRGLVTGRAGAIEDLSSIAAVLPLLKGAGVLTGMPFATASSGLAGAAEGLQTVFQPGLIGATRATAAAQGGFLKPAEGVVSKGLIGSALRAGVARAAENPLAIGDLLNSYATRPLSLQALGESMLSAIDQGAAFKASALGQAVTKVSSTAAIASIQERGIGALAGGTISPNTKLAGIPTFPGVKIGPGRSELSDAISNTPALGHSLSWGPFGEPRPALDKSGNPIIDPATGKPQMVTPPLGNMLDLSAFVWAPEGVLKGVLGKDVPKLGDMANSLSRVTPAEDTVPITRATGMSYQNLVDAVGGDAGGGAQNLGQAMRYWALQGAMTRDAAQWLRDAKGLQPADAAWANAMRDRLQAVSATVKADPLEMERLIASATPQDIGKQMAYMFADRPEMLARRGQGAPVLADWHGATKSLEGTTAADATVNPWTRGQGQWLDANQADISGVLENFPSTTPAAGEAVAGPLRTAEGEVIPPSPSLAGGAYELQERMAKRLASALDPDAVIAIRRADNALGSAQQLTGWSGTWDRLRGVQSQLAKAIPEASATEAGAVTAPRGLQVTDLAAVGFTPAEIDAMRSTANKGLTGAKLTVTQAQSLADNLTARMNDLRTGFVKQYEESRLMNDKAIGNHARDLALSAPRDVTLADDQLMQDLAQRGYQPIAMHPDTITLNHVSPGNTATLAAANQVSPVMDFLGIGDRGPGDKEIAQLRQNALMNELSQVAKTSDAAATGDELLGRVRDVARYNPERDVPFPGMKDWKLYGGREISDLRQVTPRMMTGAGFSPEDAWNTYSAIRRGAAFGFDMARPIATARNLVDALRYSGLPGIEDAIRTLVSVRGRLPDVVAGPAGHFLNLPDDLVRARDFFQFSSNPMFSAARQFKTRILRATEDLPFDLLPHRRIAEIAAESGNSEEFMKAFTDNFTKAVGLRGSAYASLLEHPDFGAFAPGAQGHGTGMFGWTSADGEALDAYHLAMREHYQSGIPFGEDLPQSSYDAIGRKLNSIYRYSSRSPLQKSLNYMFFPLSFNLKVANSIGGWFLQNPARLLVANAGLKMFDTANNPQPGANVIGGWIDRVLPIVTELNKLNFFAHGFGVGFSPIGGRNQLLWNLGKDVNATIQGDPRLGAYVPIGLSDENLPTGLQLMANLIPAWRQMQTMGKAVSDQTENVLRNIPNARAAAGSEQWQVDNFYQESNDLKRRVSIDLGAAGLKPSWSTLTDPYGRPSTKVNQNYYNAVQQKLGAIAAKYPAGAKFAEARSKDFQGRTTELENIWRHPVKTRAQASILYFAAAYEQERAISNQQAIAAGAATRATRQTYQQIAGAMAQGQIPPTLPGDLQPPQVETLRSVAQQLASEDPDFTRLYDRLYRSELGPIHMVEPATGGAAA